MPVIPTQKKEKSNLLFKTTFLLIRTCTGEGNSTDLDYRSQTAWVQILALQIFKQNV